MNARTRESLLIFGIDSFTGKHLVNAVADEFEIFGTVYETGPIDNVFKCDITELSQVEKLLNKIRPDYIINLSAISFVPFENYKTIYDVNYFGVINILESLRKIQHYPKKIIFPSTAQVYGDFSKEPIKESYQTEPKTHYSISKRAMEIFLDTAKEDFNITITRPFNYIGQNQHVNFLIPKIAHHFKNALSVIELGDLDVYRDFTDVRDVALAYRQLLIPDKAFIVNICSGHYHSVEQIFKMFADISNHEMKIKVNQKYIRAKNLKYQCGDNQLLKSFGWKPKYTLTETLSWCLSNS